VATVLSDAEHIMVLSRRAADPQALLPALASVAHIYLEAGDPQNAAPLAAEFLDVIRSGRSLGAATSSLHQLSWTLTALERGAELIDALKGNTNPWARAAVAFASRDPVAAATMCADMGNPTEEAFARMAAGRMLLEQGRRTEAHEQLRRALEFYRSVGATRYIRECETLLSPK
jgi:tetratricopeptide (TPR) repeat protein